ncbi:MAG: DUF4097 family beta strand repeat-containing protein [Candidatus Hinthialibacter antarcticus]|nr:DUF4097 family beta strand repeat-containing protein [Candidatus Hinthialibacter antarcticus]
MNTRFRTAGFHLALAALVLLSIAGCGLNGKYEEEVSLSVNAEGARTIKVDTVNGKIDLKAVDGDEVKVFAIKTIRARTDSSAEAFSQSVEIKAEVVGDEVRIYAKHPRATFGKSVSVLLEVECPPDLAAKLNTVNGQVKANGMTNGVEASTTNGRVDLLDVSGGVVANTTNGRIEARLGTMETAGKFNTVNGSVDVSVMNCLADIEAGTVNGSVKVMLPAHFNGSLDASTVNGRASCDLEINAEINKKKHVKGTIGDGQGPSIRLNAVNGSTKVEELQIEEVPV